MGGNIWSTFQLCCDHLGLTHLSAHMEGGSDFFQLPLSCRPVKGPVLVVCAVIMEAAAAAAAAACSPSPIVAAPAVCYL